MSNVTMLIYLKSRKNSKNENPIFLRLTVNGKRKEVSMNRSIDSNKFDKNKQRGKGRSSEIKILNEFLNTETSKIYQLRQEIIYSGETITVENLMNKYTGIEEKQRTLIEIFINENKRNKKLISAGTYKKYVSLFNHVKNYIQFQYKITDINIKKLDYEFIINFDYYLRTEKNINNNTTVKYVTTLRKIVKTALDKDWISKDPFQKYKVSKEKVEREFLTKHEIDKIVNKNLHFDRLDKVRDIFVFCIYTGLAYIDVKLLSKNDIVIGIDSGKWIKINRKKTNTVSNIPILPVAQNIIDKYKNNPEVLNSDKLLPVLSNQKMNAYLKEIGDICGINKKLNMHLARHSFATTITLSNGVPIETVSKMLGHSSLGITQHYAKVLNPKISSDMARLKNKLVEAENISSGKSANEAI